MFKYTSTYSDWNGTQRTEDFYFGLSEADLTEMEFATKGGFTSYMNKITKAKDTDEAISAFKNLLLKTYGEKSEDGRYFVQNKEVSERFSYSPVYSEIYMRMVRDAKFAVEFFNGVLPKNMQRSSAELAQAMKDVDVEMKKASKEVVTPNIVSATSEGGVIDVPSENATN